MQKLVPVRNSFLLPREYDLIDQRQRLARIRQQPGGGIARFAFRGIGLAVIVRIARQHHALVGIVLGQVIRPAAHRPPIQNQVAFTHAVLRVEALGLRRHRREERHRQPVCELGILAVYLDTISVFVNHLYAWQQILVQVEKRVRIFLHRLLQRSGVLFQTDDVIAHHAENRQMQLRMGEALDLVYIVGRRH